MLPLEGAPRRDRRQGAPEVLGLLTVNPRTREIDYVYAAATRLLLRLHRGGRAPHGVGRAARTPPAPPRWRALRGGAADPQRAVRSMRAAPSEARARRLRPPDGARRAAEAAVHSSSPADKGVHARTHLDASRSTASPRPAARWPQLRAAVGRRVRAFIAKEEARTKEAEPNSARDPMLAAAARAGPTSRPPLDEMLIVACQACREHLLAATGGWQADGCTDEQRPGMWRGGAAGSSPSTSASLDAGEAPRRRADAFHGRCSPWLRATLRTHCARALAVDSWPDSAALRVPLPPKPALVARLKAAVARSAKKGYHTPHGLPRVHARACRRSCARARA